MSCAAFVGVPRVRCSVSGASCSAHKDRHETLMGSQDAQPKTIGFSLSSPLPGGKTKKSFGTTPPPPPPPVAVAGMPSCIQRAAAFGHRLCCAVQKAQWAPDECGGVRFCARRPLAPHRLALRSSPDSTDMVVSIRRT